MNKILKFIFIFSIFFFGIFIGQNYDLLPNSLFDKKSTPILNNKGGDKADLSLFWKVWDTVSEKYINKSKVDRNKMVDGAISGMVNALGDPYSVYLSAEQNKNFKDNLSGKYSGVGIQIGYKGEKMVVIAPLDDTPASKAGVKPNDQILKIGDKDTQDLTLPQAVSLIRGEPGTKISLTMTRESEEKPFEVSLTREEIIVKTVVLKEAPENAAYIKISQFGDNTNEDWDVAVTKILSKNYQKVILDLRNNPGGRFDKAVHIASEFINSGVVARQVWYDGRKQDYKALGAGKLTKIPLVVIVNKGSASASEILAGALRESDRSKIIGESTFGKGTVQEVEEFDNGGGLHITSSKWLTPQGSWVDETKGLKPDVEVKVEEDKKAKTNLEDDPFVKKALEIF